MKRIVSGSLLIILIVVVGLGILVQKGLAAPWNQEDVEQIVRGAQLYDDWTKIVDPAPVLAGTHPIWSSQSTNTQSGVDTWRCVSCHGWDYKGTDGAFRAGPNYTGFPGIYEARTMEFSEFQNLMDGTVDPNHNFNLYLSSTDVASLGLFIRNGLVDDNEFIDPVSLKVLGGDLVRGQQRYTDACAACHGADGRQIVFRYEGQEINLGKLAVQDPWRFLHRTRFGTARAPEMVIGMNLGWTVEEGRDVLLFAQTLPTGLESSGTPSIGEQTPGSGQQPGGPASNLFTGILTALGAMATGLGFALVLGLVLIGIIFLVVWVLRGRK